MVPGFVGAGWAVTGAQGRRHSGPADSPAGILSGYYSVWRDGPRRLWPSRWAPALGHGGLGPPAVEGAGSGKRQNSERAGAAVRAGSAMIGGEGGPDLAGVLGGDAGTCSWGRPGPTYDAVEAPHKVVSTLTGLPRLAAPFLCLGAPELQPRRSSDVPPVPRRAVELRACPAPHASPGRGLRRLARLYQKRH
jgi:hypothetical protein